MDNTSIITQVANPKEDEIISSSQEKGERCSHTHTHTLLVLFVDAGFVYKRARDSTLLHPGSN